MKKTITFRTEVQAMLFDQELSGQISDGMWENASPRDHWKPWCDAEIRIGSEVGRDFYPRKDNYDFTKGDLLEVVGERMVAYARICLAYGWQQTKVLEKALDLDGKFRGMPADDLKGDYWDRVRAELAPFDLEKLKAVVEDETKYKWTDLLKDLREMKRTVRTMRQYRR